MQRKLITVFKTAPNQKFVASFFLKVVGFLFSN